MSEPRDHVDFLAAGWKHIYPNAFDTSLDALSVSLRLMRAGRILQGHLDVLASKHGFAVPGDYEVLAALRHSHPDPLQPSDLADRLMITTAGMTGRLDRLEQAGLIDRRPHPNDRRATAIHITERGIAVADKVFTEQLATESALFQDLTDSQRHQLGNLLRAALIELGDEPPVAQQPSQATET